MVVRAWARCPGSVLGDLRPHLLFQQAELVFIVLQVGAERGDGWPCGRCPECVESCGCELPVGAARSRPVAPLAPRHPCRADGEHLPAPVVLRGAADREGHRLTGNGRGRPAAQRHLRPRGDQQVTCRSGNHVDEWAPTGAVQPHGCSSLGESGGYARPDRAPLTIGPGVIRGTISSRGGRLRAALRREHRGQVAAPARRARADRASRRAPAPTRGMP